MIIATEQFNEEGLDVKTVLLASVEEYFRRYKKSDVNDLQNLKNCETIELCKDYELSPVKGDIICTQNLMATI